MSSKVATRCWFVTGQSVKERHILTPSGTKMAGFLIRLSPHLSIPMMVAECNLDRLAVSFTIRKEITGEAEVDAMVAFLHKAEAAERRISYYTETVNLYGEGLLPTVFLGYRIHLIVERPYTYVGSMRSFVKSIADVFKSSINNPKTL